MSLFYMVIQYDDKYVEKGATPLENLNKFHLSVAHFVTILIPMDTVKIMRKEARNGFIVGLPKRLAEFMNWRKKEKSHSIDYLSFSPYI